MTLPRPTEEAEIYSSTGNIDQDSINTLIYDYLIHNCFGETADSFKNSNGVVQQFKKNDSMDLDKSDLEDSQMEIDQEPVHSIAKKTLDTRKKLRDFILDGSIVEAIDFCDLIFPNLLLNDGNTKSRDVLFALRCQQFIECIKTSAPKALQFAQKGFKQLIKNSDSLLQSIIYIRILFKKSLH
jgi:hypothetical protein